MSKPGKRMGSPEGCHGLRRLPFFLRGAARPEPSSSVTTGFHGTLKLTVSALGGNPCPRPSCVPFLRCSKRIPFYRVFPARGNGKVTRMLEICCQSVFCIKRDKRIRTMAGRFEAWIDLSFEIRLNDRASRQSGLLILLLLLILSILSILFIDQWLWGVTINNGPVWRIRARRNMVNPKD